MTQRTTMKGGTDMGGKNKGGREARKPKQPQNVKAKGQTPASGAATKAAPPLNIRSK